MSEGDPIRKEDLEPVFRAWYDHKMEPDDPEFLRVHNSSLDSFKTKLEGAMGSPLSRSDVRHALAPRFSRWLKENNLPPLPKR